MIGRSRGTCATATLAATTERRSAATIACTARLHEFILRSVLRIKTAHGIPKSLSAGHRRGFSPHGPTPSESRQSLGIAGEPPVATPGPARYAPRRAPPPPGPSGARRDVDGHTENSAGPQTRTVARGARGWP